MPSWSPGHAASTTTPRPPGWCQSSLPSRSPASGTRTRAKAEAPGTGKDPKQAADELSRRWDTLSRSIRRHLTQWYAVRVREPHGDACPHDHLIAYVRPEEVETLRALVAQRFPGRAGDVDPITDARGSTYAQKYIAKNTTGTDQDEDGEDDPTEAVRTYRTVWGIRTFAFLGLPRGARTLYRVMRQIPQDLEHPADQELQQAAQAGQVRRFLELYQRSSPALLTEDTNDRYGDPVTLARGLITSDGEPLELPRYELVPAEDHASPPSYDEWAKDGTRVGTRDPGASPP